MAGKNVSHQIWLNGFNHVLKKLKIVSSGGGNCLAQLKVEQEHVNCAGLLHSGLSVTLVDVLSAVALNTHEKGFVPTVSVDLNLRFMESAKVGEEILIDAKTIRRGKALAFCEVLIKNKSTEDLLINGSQTLYLMQPEK